MQHSQLPEPVKALYPWHGRFIEVDGNLRMHYLDEGTGEPLLMVHGNPTWSFYWRTLVGPLTDRYRCIVPDHIGCGLSDKPAKWRGHLSDHIDNLAQLIEELDLQDVTLVVHDWGGAIGFGAALKHPSRIKRLVVFNTAVFLAPVPWSIRMCRWRGAGPLLVQGFNGFARVAQFRAIADRSRLQGAVGQGYLAPYNGWEARRAHLRFVRDIPIEPDHPTRRVIEELAARVGPELNHLPALIIWGEQDFVFTNDFLTRWSAMFPSAEVHSLPDAGHYVVEDAHERIVPMVRAFLDRHPLLADWRGRCALPAVQRRGDRAALRALAERGVPRLPLGGPGAE